MSYVSVDELELLSFFEVEPSRVDPEAPWVYNELTYQLKLGQYAISFTICPSYRDLWLSVTDNDKQVYSFAGRSIEDVRYHKDADGETLEIVVSDRDTIWLRLRPNLAITQGAGEA